MRHLHDAIGYYEYEKEPKSPLFCQMKLEKKLWACQQFYPNLSIFKKSQK